MDNLKKPILLVLGSLAGLLAQAQESNPDPMTANGKIYVVLAVVVTIVIGLFLYLLNLDRKINRLEKNRPGGNV